MLVLERKNGEGLTIVTATGEVIHISLVSVLHGRAKLGIKASKDVVVVRDELLHTVADQVTLADSGTPTAN